MRLGWLLRGTTEIKCTAREENLLTSIEPSIFNFTFQKHRFAPETERGYCSSIELDIWRESGLTDRRVYCTAWKDINTFFIPIFAVELNLKLTKIIWTRGRCKIGLVDFRIHSFNRRIYTWLMCMPLSAWIFNLTLSAIGTALKCISNAMTRAASYSVYGSFLREVAVCHNLNGNKAYHQCPRQIYFAIYAQMTRILRSPVRGAFA